MAAKPSRHTPSAHVSCRPRPPSRPVAPPLERLSRLYPPRMRPWRRPRRRARVRTIARAEQRDRGAHAATTTCPSTRFAPWSALGSRPRRHRRAQQVRHPRPHHVAVHGAGAFRSEPWSDTRGAPSTESVGNLVEKAWWRLSSKRAVPGGGGRHRGRRARPRGDRATGRSSSRRCTTSCESHRSSSERPRPRAGGGRRSPSDMKAKRATCSRRRSKSRPRFRLEARRVSSETS